jgi:NAD(P)-dependent dehydrogenase (short-subunit alcohol dehydrogenase family)
MFETIFKEFGGVDLLVNNAGISYEAPFLEATEEFFNLMTNTDWKGVFFCSQIVAKKMIELNKKGCIINIASNQIYGCWPGASVYAPSKASVVQFTKNAAMELSHYGIRMVAIAPGYTDVGWPEGDIRYEAMSRLPLKRFASTEEIAEAVLFLASDKAGYITGTCLAIDGGATLPVVAKNDFVD